ncbi:MAG: Fic family protein [Terriglobales bacterium]
MSVRQADNPALFNRVQEQNLLRQYDLLTNCIEIGLEKGIESFDKYALWALNAAAVANIAQLGGRFRRGPVSVGDHRPPRYEEVPELVDEMISLVHENWTSIPNEVALAAFVLWRMCWIHPFIEGNGRTARAACYYLICLKQRRLLPGRRTVAERIRQNRRPYVEALRAADAVWEASSDYDCSQLNRYLEGLLKAQLTDADV